MVCDLKGTLPEAIKLLTENNSARGGLTSLELLGRKAPEVPEIKGCDYSCWFYGRTR